MASILCSLFSVGNFALSISELLFFRGGGFFAFVLFLFLLVGFACQFICQGFLVYFFVVQLIFYTGIRSGVFQRQFIAPLSY